VGGGKMDKEEEAYRQNLIEHIDNFAGINEDTDWAEIPTDDLKAIVLAFNEYEQETLRQGTELRCLQREMEREGMQMRGYKVKQILTKQDLIDAEYDFILEYIDFESIKGNYIIVGNEPMEFESVKTATVYIVTNVDRRVFIELAAVHKQADDLWITEAEVLRVTT